MSIFLLDDEGIDYLQTQAVADFLVATNDPLLDGIIFPSAQVKEGYNVVLFHESARVAEDTFPKGTEIEASTERPSVRRHRYEKRPSEY